MRRLVLVWLVAAAIFAVGLYAANAYMRARAAEYAQDELQARAKVAALTVDRLLQSRLVEVFTLAALPSMRGYAASDEPDRSARAPIALGELHAISAADPNIRAASILNEAGLVVLTTDSSMNADWSDRVFTREALSGQLYASGPSRDFGEISQYYAAPILNNAGDVAGALVVRVGVQEMWDLLAVQPNILIVDENGVCIGDSSASPITFYALAPLSQSVATQAIEDKQYGADVNGLRSANAAELASAVKQADAHVVYRDAKGGTRYAAIRQIENKPWSVVAVEDESSIVQEAQETTLLLVATAAVAALIGAGATLLVLWSPRRKGTS